MRENLNYESPQVDLLEVEVEIGFAASQVSTPVNGTIREIQDFVTY